MQILRQPTELSAIYTFERETITWPCADCLSPGESIVSATIGIAHDHGVADPTPDNRISSTYQISGTNVIQLITEPVAGACYRCWAVIETSFGRRIGGVGIFYGKAP